MKRNQRFAKYGSRARGQMMPEFTASLILIVPMIVISAYVMIQASQAYIIHCTLKQAASTAARKLALAYGLNPKQTVRNWQEIISSVEYPGVVNSYRQFDLGEQGFNEKVNPPTVSVKVRFLSDQYGCRHFPEPDILGLGRNFEISAESTCRLE